MIEIRGKKIKTKKALTEFVRNILARASCGKSLQGFYFNFVKDLFERHPDAVTFQSMGGIIDIQVRKHAGFHHREFWIVLANGHERNVSFHNAIKTKKVTHETKVKSAFRESVSQDTSSFKRAWFSRYGENTRCPICTDEPLTWDNSQVDHVGIKFRDIVSEFLDTHHLTFDAIQVKDVLRGTGRALSCPVLRHTFYTFHAERANYRMLSKKANVWIESHKETTSKPGKREELHNKLATVRKKYAEYEDKALRAFNRRLTMRHALTRGQFSEYLDKIIQDEVLTSDSGAQAFDAWIVGLYDEYTKS